MFALIIYVFLNNCSMKTFSQQRRQQTELSFQPVSMFKVTSLSFLSLLDAHIALHQDFPPPMQSRCRAIGQ